MTDRYYALTVILDKDYRSDDAEWIMNAIKMIKGVIEIQPLIANHESWIAEEKALIKLREQMKEILYPGVTK